MRNDPENLNVSIVRKNDRRPLIVLAGCIQPKTTAYSNSESTAANAVKLDLHRLVSRLKLVVLTFEFQGFLWRIVSLFDEKWN